MSENNKLLIDVLDLIPGTIRVNTKTYIAQEKGWRKLSEYEISRKDFADLHIYKFGGGYQAGFYYNGSCVAYIKSDNGVYRNIFAGNDSLLKCLNELNETLQLSILMRDISDS